MTPFPIRPIIFTQMPSYGSRSSNQTMDEMYLRNQSTPNEALFYEESQCSPPLPQSGLLYNPNPAFNSYPPSFGRQVGPAYLDNTWYNAPCAEPSNLQNEPEYPQASTAKRVKTDGNCSQGTHWNPTVQPRQESIPQRDACGHQKKCKAARDLNLEIITESVAKPQGEMYSPSQDSKDLSSPQSSYQESPVTRSSLKRSSSTSTTDGHISKVPSSQSKNITDDHTAHPTRQAKASHCQVERKYRENLNTKFEILRRTIPSMQPPISNKQLCDGGDVEDVDNVVKPRKADILSSATDYVKQLEERNSKMGSEIQFLRNRVKAIEKLLNCEDCYLLNGIQNMRVEPPGSAQAGSVACEQDAQWME
ncbi:hypothetical protein MMC30_003880 [Trapelia coarctata]|nr:hypothetical protein [Trapelia coarctata]